MKGSAKPWVYSMWISIAITVFSSFLTNRHIIGEFPDIQYTSEPFMGMTYWGYPLGWLKQVLYPETHKVLIFQNFAINIIIWFLISLLILRLILHPEAE